MLKFTTRLALAAAVIAINAVVASRPAHAKLEYEIAILPDGSPIIVCESCWFWNCNCTIKSPEQET